MPAKRRLALRERSEADPLPAANLRGRLVRSRPRAIRLEAFVDRHILPIPDKHFVGATTYDAKDPDTKFPPIEPLRPPQNAPNVLIVLLDDVGFGASSAFGGPVRMPTAERLANNGLKYNRFHTTALCSPTRQALLTGRNHHSVGMGGITEIATSAPGYSSIRPKSAAPLAEVLKLNGYSTAQFGKCHEVPVWETSPLGPFTQWPTGSGFERFYGFIAGETNQWVPALYRDTVPIEPPDDPDYHLTVDLTDRAIEWIAQQKALMPDKPFFVYFAPGAAHAPHHVPKEWADKYKGAFDRGWDALRDEIFARQKKLGVIPPHAQLTERPAEIPAWDDVADDMKPVLARQMEVFAGFLEHTDHHLGRLVDALDRLRELDNTLIYYIIGDNGASAEGTPNGTFNELLMLNGITGVETPAFLRERIDTWGSPQAYNHYAVGWAHATDTPYQWTKQVASHWGGTRNGAIVHWPNGVRAKGEIRSQFHHVIDVAPTILEAAGLPHPTIVNSIQQKPMEGFSMLYSFDNATAPDAHETQYFEMFVNRGIYHKGWTAVTRHSTPWVTAPPPPLDDDVWELYAPDDWTQAHDIAKENPQKLHDLQRLFLIEAAKYDVLPLDDRRIERFNSDLAGRPTLIKGTSQLLFRGMTRLGENVVLNVKNKSHSVSAQLEVDEREPEGVMIQQGGRFGGWALYAKNGRPAYCYNFAGIKAFTVYGDAVIRPGDRHVRVEFAYDGGGLGKGGTVTLYLDGKKCGEGRVDATMPMVFSGDETCDVGVGLGTVVSPDLPARGNEFSGKVKWVQIEIGEQDDSHVVTVEDLYRIAMARQ